MIDIKICYTFKCLTDDSVFELVNIKDTNIVNGSKKKLTDELFTFIYINTSKEFTNHLMDIKNALKFKSLIKIN